ncbi:hypothetical protein ACHAXR_009272 [Thalassiosira sp. AJA248-18]
MATQQPPPPPRRPRKIRPLPKEVVDRIAAGEVVQRPVSVVKELIENCLDADGTQIDVQCQRGGIDSITVTDNGIGISPRDLPLACTRFATSKLVEVDDLKSIRTFGFRGEALASASMVARVGITSRVRPRGKKKNNATTSKDDNVGECNDNSSSEEDDAQQHSNCAYKMQYKDGKPDAKINPNSKPKPSAGREGTVIQVQDLFYNIPSRRRAMEGSRRSERDEYDRILNVVQRYAVHEAKRGVGFLCRGGGGSSGGGSGKGKGKTKKGGFGGGNTDLNTQSLASVKRIQERRKQSARPSTSAQQKPQQSSTEGEQFAATKDVIGHIFGTAVTRELLPLKAGEGDVEAVGLAALKAMVQKKESDSSSSADVVMDITDGSNENNQEQQVGDGSNDFTNSLLEEMMMGGQANNNDDIASKKTKDSTQEQLDPSTNNTKTNTTQTSKFAFAYKATGLITNGSYTPPKSSTAFLLFINDRLVESSSIKRVVESVYSDTLPKGGKPFVYLSLELPGPHVDVNVHPTKREVAFLHEDRLCEAVSKAVREVIGGATTSRTFSVANGGRLLSRGGEAARGKKQQQMNQAAAAVEGLSSEPGLKENMVNLDATAATGVNEKVSSLVDDTIASMTNGDNDAAAKVSESNKKTPRKRAADENKSTTSSNKKPIPSRLVRTSRALPVGALEPFLVQRESKAGSGEKVAEPLANSSNQFDATAPTTVVMHKPGCPLANSKSGGEKSVDLSMPGAFASAICRCQVERSETLPPAPNGIVVRNTANANNVVRPKKITPTPCDYESMSNLREEITNLNHQSLNETLRGSTYVGAVSRSRSLIQCGIDLIMINHRDLAREMFYQIALLKFNGMPIAELGGGGVDVMAAIGQMLQFEEDLNSSSAKSESESIEKSSAMKVSKTNADLARQATTCLAEKASMLEEYFSIKFEKVQVYSDMQKQEQVTSLRITGLPILLDGHAPPPHGLPIFLLRLATEVDWTEEQPCFKGVCTELASFYSELPFDAFDANSNDDNATSEDDEDSSRNPDFIDDEAKKYIKHTLFPAISFLLVPPRNFADNGAVIKLANLTSLYKVFERC